MSKMFSERAIISKEDCDWIMNEVRNACFFCSLKEGLKRFNHWGANLTYAKLFELGRFSETTWGQFVDTADDWENIQLLARNLNVRIVLYTEDSDNVVNLNATTAFGPNSGEALSIRIVKVHGKNHFNLMTGMNMSLREITLLETSVNVTNLEFREWYTPTKLTEPFRCEAVPCWPMDPCTV